MLGPHANKAGEPVFLMVFSCPSNKQQPVRPALPTLKTENGQVAGQNKVVGHLTTVQQQQQATNLQQVVNAAGNK